MGSPRQFARAQSPTNAPVATAFLLLAREFIQWPGQDEDKMRFLLTLATILFCFFTIGSSAPQHARVRQGDGYIDVGGVYDSPAAQAYWATRFGAGFFTDLRALKVKTYEKGAEIVSVGLSPDLMILI